MVGIFDTYEFYSYHRLVFSLYFASLLVPFSVTSWYRTESRNKAVGGVPNSKHLRGLAVDIVTDNAYDKNRLRDILTSFDLEVIVESDHIHVEIP